MSEIRDLPLVQDIILDLTESQLDVVYANQYDKSRRTINCHIQDEGVDFDCSDYTIELWIKKSNGYAYSDTIVGENAIGSVSGNIVSFPILEKMTYSYGRQECRLAFISGDTITYSCNFYIRVNKAPNQNDDVIDSNDYKTFHDEYLELKGLIDNIEVDNISSEAVKMADGTDLETKIDDIEESINSLDATPDNIVLYTEDGEVTEIPEVSGGGSGSITVDSELSDTSTNPVQNKVVKQAIDDLSERIDDIGGGSGGSSITVDSELSTTSTNPVQNKVITTKLDEVFQSVSNGKSLIASAITDKGIVTISDATFEEMALNISRIPRGVSYIEMNPQIEIVPFTLIQE